MLVGTSAKSRSSGLCRCASLVTNGSKSAANITRQHLIGTVAVTYYFWIHGPQSSLIRHCIFLWSHIFWGISWVCESLPHVGDTLATRFRMKQWDAFISHASEDKDLVVAL